MTEVEMQVEIVKLNAQLADERAKCKRAARQLRIYEEDIQDLPPVETYEDAYGLMLNLLDQMRDCFKILRKEGIIE